MNQSPRPPALHVSADRALDLIHGLLEPAARQAVLDHLKQCVPCETRFQEVAASHARAQSASTVVLQTQRAAARPALAWRRPGRVWMLAAAVTAAIGVTWFSRQSRVTSPAIRDLELTLPTAQLRGAIRGLGTSPADSVVLAGLEAYDRNDLPAAQRLLASVHGSGRMEEVRRIYLGGTLLKRGDAAGACAALRGVQALLVPEPWKSEARWTLALALAQSGEAAAADSLFRVLAEEPGPVAQRAQSYLATRSRPK